MKTHTHRINQISFKNRLVKSVRLQAGFSLIEIMIAAVILSIGILGIAGLQLVGLKGTHQSYMKQQAVAIVQTLTERMHSNKQGVIQGDYERTSVGNNFSCATLPNCSTFASNCSAADIASVDLHNIICGYQSGSAPSTGGIRTVAAGDINALANGSLTITCPSASGCASGDVRIDVQWREREFGMEEIEETEAGTTDSLIINTRITP